ncbi:11234_t:CDS:2 [Funneliformis geosporum]|uniref:7291_t:CDS:1 n=1 Tax=Funneliformis geosporum TaxID=1117311 RepID=A0A9W4X4Q0_9GLOM|nr:7291_t:CDS:2 [Funneliformis geosporum]CAI2195695.1 11234_t:CDS:2 [Funneliformis geosporum]
MVVDVIEIVLKDLCVRDLLSALLVNRVWSQAAVPLYWKAPFSHTKKRSMLALKIYKLFLEQERGSAGSSAVQNQPLYDYPIFLKELNYTNLLACEETYDRSRIVEKIFQMLTNREVHLNAFIMENTGANNERVYGLWTKPCYASLFSSLVHVEIHTPFPKNNVMKALANNCTKLSHIDINLHDTSVERAKESLNYLEVLITAQKSPLNLRLVFPNGTGNILIEKLCTGLESFKRLELVKWNFTGCYWGWLKKCPNLTEFAITDPPPAQVTSTLGIDFETYRLKMSKNSKVVTAHWHFDKGDKISSKFYFHPDKTLMEPYDEKPPVVIQPRVIRKIDSAKKHQYMLENLLKRMESEFFDNFYKSSDISDDFNLDDYDYSSDEWNNCYD